MGLVAGVDLGGTKIQTVVLDGDRVVGQDRRLTPRTTSDDVMDAIAESVATASTAAGTTASALDGIGVGSPGRIDAATGTVSGSHNVPGFADPVPLGPLLAQRIGGPTPLIDNDIRVAVRGELAHGALAGATNALAVFLGTGVGGGLVVDGRLLHGRGAAGEIGHVLVRPEGRRCGCGLRGHFEAYAGRASMERKARALAEHGHRTRLFAMTQAKGRDRIPSSVWVKAAEDGDAVAVRLLTDLRDATVAALGIVQNLLDLETVVIGGGLGDRLGDAFRADVAHRLPRRLFNAGAPPSIVGTGLGDLSGAIGAAVLAAEG